MRLALYLRRSTDEIRQADSIASQEAVLRQWAADGAHSVWGEVFVDSASGRTSDRPAFQRLVSLITAGAPFDGVLVRDVSRLGRFLNIDEAAFWEFLFLSRGVRVFYAQESFRDGDDPFSAIQKALKRFAAAEFSREKGRLLQYGKYRNVCRGFWRGGSPPYGYVRVLLSQDKTILRELRDGERKMICAERVSLRPAADGSANVVRRIFRLYADRRMTPVWIARRFTREGLPSPRRGTRWYVGTIYGILSNPAYVGLSAARFEKSENFPKPIRVEVAAEWPALVSAGLWKRAQAIRVERRDVQTGAGREEKMRTFFAAHGEFALRYRSGRAPQWLMPNGISTDDSQHRAAQTLTSVDDAITALQAEFALIREGNTVLLENKLRVGFAVSLPRGHVLGGVGWRFDFDGSETQDMTVAVGLGPDLQPAVYFVYVNMRWRRKARRMAPRLAPGLFATVLPRTWTETVEALRSNMLRYSTLSKTQFLHAIAAKHTVNTYEVARELGWAGPTARAMYKRLLADGEALPPLSKSVRRRITVVCDDCGTGRSWTPSQALQFTSGLCRACYDRRRKSPEYCSACGIRRAIPRLKSRLCDLCTKRRRVVRSRTRLREVGRHSRFTAAKQKIKNGPRPKPASARSAPSKKPRA